MIVIKQSGNFNKSEAFLKNTTKIDYLRILEKYGREGASALAATTPVDSGLTSSSWGYEVRRSGNSFVINWTNSNIVNGVLIAIILQYGHGTRNGGYVQGRDYINPALRSVFDKIADEAWKEVIK